MFKKIKHPTDTCPNDFLQKQCNGERTAFSTDDSGAIGHPQAKREIQPKCHTLYKN